MTIVQDMLPAVSEISQNVDWLYILKTALLAAAAVCIIGGVLRLIFGKGSKLVRSVSASINVVMIYLTAIILYVLAPQLRDSLTSLPFISVSEEAFYLWDITSLTHSSLFPALLQLFVLAFLVNVMETFLPQGKNFLSWYGFRLLSVAASLGLYTLLGVLVQNFAPQIYGEWAGFILLGLWLLILLTGLLKVLLAVILTAVNPIIGTIYTFFFSNIFGRQFSKAILTTLLCVALLMLLRSLGISAFAFETFSLASYGPTCIIAVLALYLFGKLL